MVFAIHQYELAIGIHISPPSLSPFPPPSRLSQSTGLGYPASYITLSLAIYFTYSDVYVSLKETAIVWTWWLDQLALGWRNPPWLVNNVHFMIMFCVQATLIYINSLNHQQLYKGTGNCCMNQGYLGFRVWSVHHSCMAVQWSISIFRGLVSGPPQIPQSAHAQVLI